MKEFTFTLSDEQVHALMWLVEGNNAFADIAEKIRVQIDSQGDE